MNLLNIVALQNIIAEIIAWREIVKDNDLN